MAEDGAYRDAGRSNDERATDLLGRMTLDEKLAQLAAVWASDLMQGPRFDPVKAKDTLAHGTGQVTRIGASTVLGPAANAALINDIQKYLVEETRLGIPAVVHEESCAGLTAKGATQFPQAIGLGSTFDPDLVFEMANVIRRQMRALGARQTLAPVLDVARDPRWGRCEETFGEDPYLTGRMGVSYVRGVQGENLRKGVVATAKHFMGYGAPEGGRNWGPSQLPTRELLERILPPFTAAISEASLGSVMNGYQEIDGVPCGASRWLLTELLRDTLGFTGTVVADYYTVDCLQSFHRIAADASEAGARALEAGLDVELPVRNCYGQPLLDAVESGRVDGALIDRAVLRVLKQKFALGIFEEPFVHAAGATEFFDTPKQRALARKIARKSMVLLKNEGGLLPLSKDLKRIAVIGPNADSIRNLQGDYHYPAHVEVVFGPMHEPGHPRQQWDSNALMPGQAGDSTNLLDHFVPSVSVLSGIRNAVTEGTEVVHALGCTLTGDASDAASMDEAVDLAAGADTAIVVVGGRSGLLRDSTCGEAADATRLELTGAQQQLITRVVSTGTPTVVVLLNGRVLALTDVAEVAPAILEAWCPGEEGGNAVADVLFGDENPAGRLPITMPRSAGQVPLYYNHKPSGAISMFHVNYSDSPVKPLYAFGHGLSYTRFEYSDLTLSQDRPCADDNVLISARVTNVGDVAGDEVVQLYVRDVVGSLTRPHMELKGFHRTHIAPGESKVVSFDLSLTQLAFYDLDMQLVVEPGEVAIMVGTASDDIRLEQSLWIEGESHTVGVLDVQPTVVQEGWELK